MTHKNFKFPCPYVKLYWNTDPLIYLHTVYSSISIATTGLKSCNKDHMSWKSLKYLLSALLQKKLVDHWFIAQFLRREGEDMGSRAHAEVLDKKRKRCFVLRNRESVIGLYKYKQFCRGWRRKGRELPSPPHTPHTWGEMC